MYSVGPYFLGRYLAELPGAIIGPAVFGGIIYPIVGLNTVYAWKFPLFLAILILIYNTAGSASLIMSAAFKRKESAVTLAPLFLLTSQLFCGFIVNLNQIPAWIAQIQYLSYVKYAY